MVMPLGPDFAKALGISTAHLGIVGGSYAAAAAVAGLVAAPLLDRFDRRKALGVAIFGLVIGTAAGALARGLTSLVLARAIAGAFGGPATSIALSIIADVIPPARRGRAMGAVMGAFSVASVLGVPVGLRLARCGGWRLPFIAVAGTGVVIGVLAVRAMPSMRGHIASAEATPRLDRMRALLGDGTVRLALVMNALVMMTAFLVIPNIAAYLQQNFHYPRADIELLYFVGGATSFFVMRIAGRGIDRLGAAPVAAVGTPILIAVLYLGFIAPRRAGRRRDHGAVRVVHDRDVDPQRQPELAVDARAARRPARRLHVAAVDGAAHRVRDRRVPGIPVAARGARRAPGRDHDGRVAVGGAGAGAAAAARDHRPPGSRPRSRGGRLPTVTTRHFANT